MKIAEKLIMTAAMQKTKSSFFCSNMNKQHFSANGFAIVEDVFTNSQIEEISQAHQLACKKKFGTNKHIDLYAIRQYLNTFPEVANCIFSSGFKDLINEVAGENFFVVKSIFFDKPPLSNWIVPYHQDLTIAVKNNILTEGFSKWTKKHNQYSVQPPIEYLENIVTLRIHLDNTSSNNGALKIIVGSHLQKIIELKNNIVPLSCEYHCDLKQGGVMLMKPLLLHSSRRSSNFQSRRVIHIELSNMELPAPLHWAEKMTLS